MSIDSSYLHIWAWGRIIGYGMPHIKATQQQAAADGAPEDAIFKGSQGWHTFSDVSHPQTRSDVEAMLAHVGKP